LTKKRVVRKLVTKETRFISVFWMRKDTRLRKKKNDEKENRVYIVRNIKVLDNLCVSFDIYVY